MINEVEKPLLTNKIFSFSHDVFKSLPFLGQLKSGLCGKELMPFSYIVIASAPIHAFLNLPLPVFNMTFFQSHWLFSHCPKNGQWLERNEFWCIAYNLSLESPVVGRARDSSSKPLLSSPV